jgi:hypothetical protein
VTFRHGTGAGFGDEPAQREVTERRLIAFAEQVEQRSALGIVVVRIGAAVRLGVERPAQT